MEQVEFQKFLKGLLTERKQKNGSYSMRSLARSLRMTSTTLSGVLAGKRRVSSKLIERTLKQAAAPPEIWNKVFPFSRLGAKAVVFDELAAEKYDVISEWYYFAILSLFDTDDFVPSVAKVSKRLGISQKTAKCAIDRLLRLSFLKKLESGKLIKINKDVFSTDGVPSLALRKSHFENLDLARRSLEEDRLEERDFVALTVASNKEAVDRFKSNLREFLKFEMIALEEGQKTEVFRICVQSFPLTNRNTEY